MIFEIKAPSVGESINEITLVNWYKKDGDYVSRDEVILDIESEKAGLEVRADRNRYFKNSSS